MDDRDASTYYITTDLALSHRERLDDLVESLCSRGNLSPLGESLKGDDDRWYVTVNSDTETSDPATHLTELLDAIESLTPDMRRRWDTIEQRALDMGFWCSGEPWCFQRSLTSELLTRIGAAGLTLGWTLYSAESARRAEAERADRERPS
ncbi:MAG: hypothetical protein RL885_21630 [Planctomycetota bacterium]